MAHRWCSALCLVLGIVLGAGLLAPRAVSAQVDTARTDTAPPTAEVSAALRDSLLADSLRAEAIKRVVARLADTIKAPLPTYPTGPDLEALRPLRWTREELLATGAMNLSDLLEEVPGVATFRTSWFPGVHAAAFQGDFKRLRVFLDGLEIDALDPRNNGVLDLTDISIIALDNVVVERSAGEVRVWLESWSVTSVTPYSRTDVFTGDLNTNGFRGLFGRRFMNGAVFQLTMQQGETSRQAFNPGFGLSSQGGQTGDGDLRHITARVGWAGRGLSVDGYLATMSRSRDLTAAEDENFAIDAYDGGRRDAYVRVGYGDPARGWSAQAIVGAQRGGPDLDSSLLVEAVPEDSTEEVEPLPDSLRSSTQRVLRLGYAWERATVGAFARWRTAGGANDFSPGVSLSADRGWARATVRAERVGRDSSSRADAGIRLQLRSWLRASASHSMLLADSASGRSDEQTSRVELALGRGNRWLSGGILRQSFGDSTRRYVVPRMLTRFDTVAVPNLLGYSATGLTFGASAPLYKDLRLELHGTRWSNVAREYLPRTHIRAAFILQSEWRSQFPQGHFSINARLTHEYRGAVPFPNPADETVAFFRQNTAYNLGVAMLEIRILKATLFYQFRNLYGTAYAQVPGVPMPPPFQTYGVRWEWFN